MDALEPATPDGKLLKMGHYPEEDSVSIGREKAQELAIAASGKRTAEVNTCVLIGADPHPVWKIRLLTDDPASPVIELDAQTGEVVAVDIFKTDYTPSYVLYSTEKNWRKTELETDGPVQMAVKAVTYAYGDLWADLVCFCRSRLFCHDRKSRYADLCDAYLRGKKGRQTGIKQSF